MRIRYWSSDVCSSDLKVGRAPDAPFTCLLAVEGRARVRYGQQEGSGGLDLGRDLLCRFDGIGGQIIVDRFQIAVGERRTDDSAHAAWKSEERRVGNEGVSTCRSRGSP